MPKVTGIESLQARIKRLQNKVEDARTVVVVGFSQRYAIFVHEVPAHHDVGQAKYLETPARTMRAELGKIIETVYKKTGSMRQALLMAGMRLQREAQEVYCPVDTSALKASAYTAEESEAEAAAVAAFNKSEAIRLATLARRAGRKRK